MTNNHEYLSVIVVKGQCQCLFQFEEKVFQAAGVEAKGRLKRPNAALMPFFLSKVAVSNSFAFCAISVCYFCDLLTIQAVERSFTDTEPTSA